MKGTSPASQGLLLLICALLAGCTGTTARVSTNDVDIETRARAATPFSLGSIAVASDVSTFADRDERENYEASLRSVLQRANIFGGDPSKPYRLDVTIVDFDIPSATFGAFNSTLDVRYELKDADGTVVFAERVSSGGSDDTGSSLGPVRQNRSRTVAVAQNIQQFTELVARRLESRGAPQVAAPAPRPPAATYSDADARPDLTPIELVGLQPGARFNFGRYHALIIGNDAYAHITPLRSAVADAQALDEILRRDYGFETRLLLDATRDEIVSALTDYRRRLDKYDNLLIYYAGHGWLDDEVDEGYWLPVDARSDDPGRWLSNSTLTTTLRAMKANHVLVVADSCFSGKLTRGVNIGIRGDDYIERLLERKARTALTSGGLEPVVDSGGEGGHSVFAAAFFEALGANDGVMDMTQMFNFIRREVALGAEQFPEYGDIRLAGHDGGDFLFVRSTVNR